MTINETNFYCNSPHLPYLQPHRFLSLTTTHCTSKSPSSNPHPLQRTSLIHLLLQLHLILPQILQLDQLLDRNTRQLATALGRCRRRNLPTGCHRRCLPRPPLLQFQRENSDRTRPLHQTLLDAVLLRRDLFRSRRSRGSGGGFLAGDAAGAVAESGFGRRRTGAG